MTGAGGGLAHVIELYEIDVLPAADAAALARVLLELLDMPADEFPYDPVYGDAYNSRERELVDRLGAVAAWLPTGRIRREAGRIAFRLALRSSLPDLHDAVADFGTALVERSTQHAAPLWNDTTYLQPAQPSSFGHCLGAFAEQITRDLARVAGAYWWVDRSPAGTGGVAGTGIPLDRHRLASLGLRRGRTTGVMSTQRTPSARTDNWLYGYGEMLRTRARGAARRPRRRRRHDAHH